MIERLLAHPRERVALIEPERGVTVTYGALADLVTARAERLGTIAGGRALVFLAMTPSIEAVALYLACLTARLPVCLTDSEAAPLARLAQAYAPRLLLLPEALDAPEASSAPEGPWGPAGYRALPDDIAPGYRGWRGEDAAPKALHPDLAVLLTTSGSTGNPKLVRLTLGSLEANARSIGEYLGLSPDERAIQSLPSHYSYGLSVLNSHLLAGGSMVLTPHSFMRPEFWKAVDETRATSFAGVPYMYEVLHRLRFTPERHASLRTLTQAGGALRPDLIAHFHGLASASHRRFFVMYGQTEATARIAYVPPERLSEKIGSIGIAIPGGRLSLGAVEDGSGLEEMIYEGPNVMMGYAETVADLAEGDVLGGRLRTGDLGRADSEGFFYVTGRLRRFAKLFGSRVSLEDVEREAESRFAARVAALDGGDRILLYVEASQPLEAAALDTGPLAAEIARYLGVPPAAVSVRAVESLPRTAAGKKDYHSLETRPPAANAVPSAGEPHP